MGTSVGAVYRNTLLSRVLSLDVHENLRVEKNRCPHPLEMGFEWSLGEPKGQVADYRYALSDGRSVHASDMGSWWAVHWDKVHPTLGRWWDHLVEDAPVWALAVFVMLIVGVVLLLVALARVLAKAGGSEGASA